MSIAQDYVNTRVSFGRPLAELQQIQAMVAGEPVNRESAMTKVFVSEAVFRVADCATLARRILKSGIKA